MINIGIGLIFIAAVMSILTGIYGTVTTLPWGLDEAMLTFMDNVNIIIAVFPPFQVIWHVFMIGLSVKIALFIFDKVLWFVQLIRG